MKFVEPPEAPKRNVLLYGPPKSWKTAAAVQAPGPVLMLNADLPNATSFAHSRTNFTEIDYEGFSTLVEIAQLANTNALAFETVVVDPVGELHRQLLEELAQGAVSPSLPRYQATNVHIERFCRALCVCPSINVVITAHELPIKDDATGTMERLPNTGTTNPALGQKLMGMVDVVAYTAVVENDDGDHLVMGQLVNAKGRRGGDRTDSLGPFRPLDLGEWFEVMNPNRGATPQEAVTT